MSALLCQICLFVLLHVTTGELIVMTFDTRRFYYNLSPRLDLVVEPKALPHFVANLNFRKRNMTKLTTYIYFAFL
jgi:hypothetical protein